MSRHRAGVLHDREANPTAHVRRRLESLAADFPDGGTMRYLLMSLSSHHRPGQIASACALGALAGCAVFSPPLLVACLALLYVLPIHLPIAAVTAVGIGALQYLYGQTFCSALGVRLLQSSPVGAWLVGAMPAKFLAWLGLARSSVIGGLAVGIAQLPFTFAATWLVFRSLWNADAMLQDSVQHGVGTSEGNWGSPLRHDQPAARLATDDQESLELANVARQPLEDQPVLPSDGLESFELEEVLEIEETTWHPSGPSVQPVAASDSEPCGAEARLESFLATCSTEDVDRLTTQDIANRAADLAAVLDELLDSVTRDRLPAGEPADGARDGALAGEGESDGDGSGAARDFRGTLIGERDEERGGAARDSRGTL
ncbi:MAG: hypothetical protein D6753_08400, partial [Planctomycetota bacterium]